MVGSAMLRLLRHHRYSNLIYKSRRDLDLLNQQAVNHFFQIEKPEFVFICAAKVGGIHANNTLRAEFLYENLQIQNNLIHAAYLNNTKKLLFLGSSCIYPKNSLQPIKEEYLLSGFLENTNEPYAIAKIAGIKLCENYFHQYKSNFFSIMPTNAFGPNDNYNLETSHVFPALIRKIHEAKINEKKSITLWGSGSPLREFIYVDDIANAAFFTMKQNFKKLYESGITHLNVGTQKEISIKELANLISKVLQYNGKIKYDLSKPDGTPRKVMDSSKINSLGWKPKFDIAEGIQLTYKAFLTQIKN